MRNDKSIPPAFTKNCWELMQSKVRYAQRGTERERENLHGAAFKQKSLKQLVKISLPHHLLQQITHLSLPHKLVVVAVAAQ